MVFIENLGYERLIRGTCLVGTPDELVERARALGQDGPQELVFAVGNAGEWRLAEEFSRTIMVRL